MYDVITSDDPSFKDLENQVKRYRHRVNFIEVSEDLRKLIEGGSGHIKLQYPHDQLSNVISSLKRRGLSHGDDYVITRVKKPFVINEDEYIPEEIILTPYN